MPQVPARGMFAPFVEVVYGQYCVIRDLVRDKRTFQPVFVIWIAAFGGALHAPVTTFFYLKLGATEEDIGWIGILINAAAPVLAPIYGRMFDVIGGFYIMVLSCALCAVGCLIRGIATDVSGLYVGGLVLGLGAFNMTTTTLAYLAATVDVKKRTAVISSFLMQVTVIKLIAKALYPLWHWFLTACLYLTDDLFVDQLSMAVCTLFCFYGVFALLVFGKEVKETEEKRLQQRRWKHTSATSAVSEVSFDDSTSAEARLIDAVSETRFGDDDAAEREFESQRQTHLQRLQERVNMPEHVPAKSILNRHFVLYGVATSLQVFAASTINVIWPLFLHERYNWASKEYAYALLASSVVTTIALASFPVIQDRLGATASGISLSMLGGFFVTVAFLWTAPNAYAATIHVLLACVGMFMVGALEPCIKTAMSLGMATSSQGMSFGVMSALSGVGDIAANAVSPRLFAMTKQVSMLNASVVDAENDTAGKHIVRLLHYGSDGALPFLLVGILLWVCAFLILLARKRSLREHQTAPGHTSHREMPSSSMDHGVIGHGQHGGALERFGTSPQPNTNVSRSRSSSVSSLRDGPASPSPSSAPHAPLLERTASDERVRRNRRGIMS
eukprot:m.97627 g.97627  ORF g.97627 m.97627 type:complete len:615 (+) comp13105_c0_seq1:156-2000(+)